MFESGTSNALAALRMVTHKYLFR